MLENKLGITSSPALAEAEERISKKKAVELFESGVLDTLEAGKFASLQTIHRVLFEDIADITQYFHSRMVFTVCFLHVWAVFEGYFNCEFISLLKAKA